MRFVLFLFFSFCFIVDCISQNNKKEDISLVSVKIDVLNKIAEKLVISNPDSVLAIVKGIKEIPFSSSAFKEFGVALMYESYAYSFKTEFEKSYSAIQEAIIFLEKTDDDYTLGFAYNQLAYLEERFGKTQQASLHFEKAILLMNKTANPVRLYIVYINYGIFHQRKGDYTKALENFLKALELVEKQQNTAGVFSCLTNIANVYFYQEEYDKALEYYFKCEKIALQLNTSKRLGTIYNNIAGAYLAKKQHKEAIPILHKSSYYQQNNRKGNTLVSTNLAICFEELKNYDSASYYNQKAIEFQQETKDKYDLVLILFNSTNINFSQKNYTLALQNVDSAYQVAQEIQSLSQSMEALNYKKNILSAQKNYKNAFEAQNLYHQLKDSLYSIESKSEINALLLERKELENTRLEQDNLLKTASLEKEQLESKAQQQAFVILEKQAEADKLFALAKESKNKQEADSLYRAAQTAQLETDNLRIKADNLDIKAQKAEAEKKAQKAKSEQEIAFQRTILLLFSVILFAALLIAFIAYQNQRNKQKINLLLEEKNKEIKLQNELLEQSNTMKDRLFSIIAHDLRDPISSFQSVSRQINFFLQKNKPKKLKEISEQIDSSAQHLNNLLNNLLNWFLTQQKQHIQIDKNNVNLHKAVEEILKSYQTLALSYGVQLKNSIPEQTTIWVDIDTFQIIIRNLVNNALKYTPTNGSISLSISSSSSIQKEKAENQITVLKIQDTGIGMSEEIKDKLESKLTQLDLNSTKRGLRGEKGTGLGLLLCYEFAALNDIEVELKSKANQGTTFYLFIPTTPH